jgi:hypothetical protein
MDIMGIIIIICRIGTTLTIIGIDGITLHGDSIILDMDMETDTDMACGIIGGTHTIMVQTITIHIIQETDIPELHI